MSRGQVRDPGATVADSDDTVTLIVYPSFVDATMAMNLTER
jgi:hypothetical protein